MSEARHPTAHRRPFAGRVEQRIRDPGIRRRALSPPPSRRQRTPITEHDDVRRRNRYYTREAEDDDAGFCERHSKAGTGAAGSSPAVVVIPPVTQDRERPTSAVILISPPRQDTLRFEGLSDEEDGHGSELELWSSDIDLSTRHMSGTSRTLERSLQAFTLLGAASLSLSLMQLTLQIVQEVYSDPMYAGKQ